MPPDPTSSSDLSRPVVAAFDFDGTISVSDSFMPFMFRAFGVFRTVLALVILLPEVVRHLLGHSSRDRMKAILVGRLFAGASVERLRRIGAVHAAALLGRLRPAARRRIAWHAARGDRLVMVSASVDIYLEPLARALGFDDLLCTRLAAAGGRFDGQLLGSNCRAAEKVRRLTALLGDLSACEIYAYGDSAGDAEMLAVADHAFMRAFERGGALAGQPV